MGNFGSGIQVPEFLRDKLPLKPELPQAQYLRNTVCPFVHRLMDYISVQANITISKYNSYEFDAPRDLTHLNDTEHKNAENADALRQILRSIPEQLFDVSKWHKNISRNERNANDQVREIAELLEFFVDRNNSNIFMCFLFDYVWSQAELDFFLTKIDPLLEHRTEITEFFDRIGWCPTPTEGVTFLPEETYSDLEIIQAIDFVDPALGQLRDTFVRTETEICPGDRSNFDLNGCTYFVEEMKVQRFLRDRHLTLTEFMVQWADDPLNNFSRICVLLMKRRKFNKNHCP